MSAFDYDLFVIGAGSGGVRAARVAAGYGARVAIAEEYRVGGTCVIRGCVPKKLLVYASRMAGDFADMDGFGFSGPAPRFDWSVLRNAKDREIDRLEAAYDGNLARAGVEVIRARAELAGANAVRLADGRRITAGHILIATGARPFLPKIAGIELAVTSNEVFDLPALPERAAVVGGGYIAVEFAGILAGLGVETTLLYRGEQILRGFDRDLRDRLALALGKRGVEVVTHAPVTGLEKTDAGIAAHLASGDRLVADLVLYAVGRRPNTEGLGLEAAGVALDEHDAVEVNAASRTSVPTIHAVGDVTNRAQLTPVAIREGHAFADSLFGGKDRLADHSMIPTAVFTTPELGTVGLTEEAAVAACRAVDVYRTEFRPMKNILAGRDERMFMKLVVDAENDRVLGCHLLGEGAGEMIQLVAVPLTMGATKRDFDRTMAVHPSAGEELVTLRTPAVRHRR